VITIDTYGDYYHVERHNGTQYVLTADQLRELARSFLDNITFDGRLMTPAQFRQSPIMRGGSALERMAWSAMCEAGMPLPVCEYRFAAEHVGPGKGLRVRLELAGLRDWRFDFAWVPERVAVEVEGGTWSRGRHSRGAGFAEDCRKYNAAALMGWFVFRVTADMIKNGEARRLFDEVRHIIDERGK